MSDLREQFEKETGNHFPPPHARAYSYGMKEYVEWLQSRLASLTAEREEMRREIVEYCLNVAGDSKTAEFIEQVFSRPLPEKGR